MEEQSKITKIIFMISIVIVILSTGFFLYSYLNVKNIESLEKKNKKLKQELETEISNYKEARIDFESKSRDIKNLEFDFMAKYGYDFEEKENLIKNNIIKELKSENKEILQDMKNLIEDYSMFYFGNYYMTDLYTTTVNKFSELTQIIATESLSTNLYDELEIYRFIALASSENDSTIGYLSGINKNNKEIKTMLFMTALYSDSLNAIAEKRSTVKDPSVIYSEILNLYDIYKQLESYGLYTGKLSSGLLGELKENFSELTKKYYENKGVLKLLEGEINEKTN